MGGELGDAGLGRGQDLLGVAVAPAHHQQDGGVEVGRDPGVEGELGRGGDVGVVGADDHHGLEPIPQFGEPVDQARERLVRVVADVFVGDADGVLVLLLVLRLVDQDFKDRVAFAGLHDRTEDRHRGDLALQGVQDADGDHRLACHALRCGQIDTALHIRMLSAGSAAGVPGVTFPVLVAGRSDPQDGPAAGPASRSRSGSRRCGSRRPDRPDRTLPGPGWRAGRPRS